MSNRQYTIDDIDMIYRISEMLEETQDSDYTMDDMTDRSMFDNPVYFRFYCLIVEKSGNTSEIRFCSKSWNVHYNFNRDMFNNLTEHCFEKCTFRYWLPNDVKNYELFINKKLYSQNNYDSFVRESNLKGSQMNSIMYGCVTSSPNISLSLIEIFNNTYQKIKFFLNTGSAPPVQKSVQKLRPVLTFAKICEIIEKHQEKLKAYEERLQKCEKRLQIYE